MLKSIGYVASFVLIASSCTNDDDSTDNCIDQSSISNDPCIEVYDPVCGCDGFTYSNTCFASNAGVQSWTTGPCQDDCIGPPGVLILCTTDYDPVCGCNGITYTNDCFAQAEGVKKWTKGACNSLCDTYGTVVKSVNEGCDLVIRLADGQFLQPTSLPSHFTLSEGQRIKFSYTAINTIDNTCVGAVPVGIDCIELVGSTCDPITPIANKPSLGGNDPLKVLSASIVGDCLNISVQYSGGCEAHDMNLYFGSDPASSNTYDLLFTHDSNGDLCQAFFSKDYAFDITSLQMPGMNTVYLDLNSTADQSFSQSIQYNY